MKKHVFRRIVIAGTALLLSAVTVFPALAEENGIGPGYEEEVKEDTDRPSDPIEMGLLREKKKNADTSENAKTEMVIVPAGEVPAPASENAPKAGSSYGTFKISGYCNCKRCSGGHNLTYSGTVPQANHTISADLDKFPLGTKLYIDGIVYTVEDKGSSVTGNRLDIFFDSHEKALDYGVKEVEVFAVAE